MTVLVHLLVMVGMLAVVPLGLAGTEGLVEAPPWRWWFAGALPGSVSLWLARGALSAVLASGYVVTTVVFAAYALSAMARDRRIDPPRIALAMAMTAPIVASTALGAERAGYRLFGYQLTTLTLTVAHFHFAGFAAALVAGLTGSVAAGRLPAAAALAVPAGTLVVLGGFFLGDWFQFAGAAILTAGLWLTGWLTLREIRPRSTNRTTRALLATCASVPAFTMLLALDYSLGEAAGLPHVSLTWMAATHGLLNALGFGLCATIAWNRLRTEAP